MRAKAPVIGFLVLLLLMLPACSPRPPRQTAPPPEHRQGGTMAVETQGWIYPDAPCTIDEEIASASIDVLKPQYFHLDDDGTLVQDTVASSGCNGYSPQNAARIKARSREQYVTISGETTGMAALTASPTRIQSFLETVLAFLKTTGMTGIELDFEGYSSWTPEQYQGFKAFLAQIGSALHQAGFKLMVDGPLIFNSQYQGYYQWRYEDFDASPLREAVDAVVVMCYDVQSDNGAGTPVAPLSTLSACCQWMKARIANPGRIIVGINSYGYIGKKGSYAVEKQSYQKMIALPGASGATRDPASGEMMWSSGSGAGTIYYDYSDTETLSLKLNAIEEAGLSRVSVWSLGGNPWFPQDSTHPSPAPPQPVPALPSSVTQQVLALLGPVQATVEEARNQLQQAYKVTGWDPSHQ